MHEVFLSRGDVRHAPPAARVAIHSYYNCVAVHPHTCHIAAESEEGRARCARAILSGEDSPAALVIAWLEAMAEFLKGTQAPDAIRYVRSLHFPS